MSSGHPPTLAALNNHATIVASGHKIATAEFHRCFTSFIEQLEASEWKLDYLEGNPTTVTIAYHDFLMSMKNEVRDAPTEDQ